MTARRAVSCEPSQLCEAPPNSGGDLLEQPVLRREEEQPDIGHRDHRQHRRREIGHADEGAADDAVVHPQRHQEGERDRDRDRAEREPEIVDERLPEDRIRQHLLVIGEADEARGAARPRRRVDAVDEAGERRPMREQGEQRHRRQEQQPAVNRGGEARRHRVEGSLSRWPGEGDGVSDTASGCARLRPAPPSWPARRAWFP